MVSNHRLVLFTHALCRLSYPAACGPLGEGSRGTLSLPLSQGSASRTPGLSGVCGHGRQSGNYSPNRVSATPSRCLWQTHLSCLPSILVKSDASPFGSIDFKHPRGEHILAGEVARWHSGPVHVLGLSWFSIAKSWHAPTSMKRRRKRPPRSR
jgi:hypothetical protein